MPERNTTKFALSRICKDLGLPQGDAYTQDWAYEIGDEYRTETHLDNYLAAYDNPDYGDSERQLLIQLILDVVNDLLQQDASVGQRAWAKTVAVVRNTFANHRAQIEYWAADGEALEDAFVLTPFARELLARHENLENEHDDGS
jgi:hypothetical protein